MPAWSRVMLLRASAMCVLGVHKLAMRFAGGKGYP